MGNPNDVILAVNAPLNTDELRTLFETAWPSQEGEPENGRTSGRKQSDFAHITTNALRWVTARRNGTLIGFAYLIGDGGAHTFLLSPVVHPDEQRRGLGSRLVQAIVDEARATGAEWLHVDYLDELEPFYRNFGFRPTAAGVMRLLE